MSLESENREQHRKQQNGIREDQSGQPRSYNKFCINENQPLSFKQYSMD